MECIGLLGGMSWESTLDDYRLFNQGIRQQLSGQHSVRILLHSVDFAEIESLQAIACGRKLDGYPAAAHR